MVGGQNEAIVRGVVGMLVHALAVGHEPSPRAALFTVLGAGVLYVPKLMDAVPPDVARGPEDEACMLVQIARETRPPGASQAIKWLQERTGRREAVDAAFIQQGGLSYVLANGRGVTTTQAMVLSNLAATCFLDPQLVAAGQHVLGHRLASALTRHADAVDAVDFYAVRFFRNVSAGAPGCEYLAGAHLTTLLHAGATAGSPFRKDVATTVFNILYLGAPAVLDAMFVDRDTERLLGRTADFVARVMRDACLVHLVRRLTVWRSPHTAWFLQYLMLLRDKTSNCVLEDALALAATLGAEVVVTAEAVAASLCWLSTSNAKEVLSLCGLGVLEGLRADAEAHYIDVRVHYRACTELLASRWSCMRHVWCCACVRARVVPR
jgi:hypothetical protein